MAASCDSRCSTDHMYRPDGLRQVGLIQPFDTQ
jgi:hypothetical protein